MLLRTSTMFCSNFQNCDCKIKILRLEAKTHFMFNISHPPVRSKDQSLNNGMDIQYYLTGAKIRISDIKDGPWQCQVLVLQKITPFCYDDKKHKFISVSVLLLESGSYMFLNIYVNIIKYCMFSLFAFWCIQESGLTNSTLHREAWFIQTTSSSGGLIASSTTAEHSLRWESLPLEFPSSEHCLQQMLKAESSMPQLWVIIPRSSSS